MVAIFALAAAVLYGSADFLGGTASRRVSALAVLQVAAFGGVAVMLAAALLSGEQPRVAELAWGAAAGAVGGLGMIVFYVGLASGPMAVVAPVSALMSAVVPVTVAVAWGERLTLMAYAGVALCLAAVVVISASASPAPGQAGRKHPAVRGVVYGLASGIAFGLFFVFIRGGGQAGPLWPVAASRMAGGAVFLIAAGAARTRPVSPSAGRLTFLAALGAGVIDAAANLCYVLAARAGLFGLAAVLSSLYPGVTVLLARVLLGERMHRAQQAGLLVAVLGIVLVSV